MCLSIPYQIKKINGQKAIVQSYNKKDKHLSLELVNNLKVGDWVLSLNNLIIEKISAQEAKQIINLYNYE